MKLHVYPMIDEKTGKLATATKLEVALNLQSLLRYLIDNEFIQEITDYNPEYLRIYPPDTLAKLQSGDPAWERMVPPEVAELLRAVSSLVIALSPRANGPVSGWLLPLSRR
ncbi:MAG TPA: hypothetical protein VF345_03220 [Chthoniobacterales bacterium]